MKEKSMIIIAVKNILVITAASVIYGAAISLLLDPNNLAPGGMTGIAVILNRLISVQTGTLYFLLNIPVMLLGIWKFGLKFIVKTFYVLLLTSVSANCLARFPVLTTDPLAAALAGGVLFGISIGMIFRGGATSGGTDIIVKILRRYFPHLRTGVLFQILDVVIVGISGLIFRDFTIVVYAMITVFVTGKMLDYILYGSDEAKIIYIITDQKERIAKRLLYDLDAGCTFLEGTGGWTGEKRDVIMTVVQKRISPKVEEVVKDLDPMAFMIIGSANEIYGDGYKDITAEKI